MEAAKTALIFLIHLFLLIHAGWCIRCYGCIGYDITRPLHLVTNNPSCVRGNFDYKQVKVYTAYTPGFSCYSFTYNTGEHEITQRYMVRSPLARPEEETPILPRNRDREYRDGELQREREFREREYREREGRENPLGIKGTIVRGFYCHNDYCNGPSAVATPMLALILLSIGVSVLRWLC